MVISKMKRGPASLEIRLEILASLQPKATVADVDMGGALDLITRASPWRSMQTNG
jgi:hypothetical protein